MQAREMRGPARNELDGLLELSSKSDYQRAGPTSESAF